MYTVRFDKRILSFMVSSKRIVVLIAHDALTRNDRVDYWKKIITLVLEKPGYNYRYLN